MQRAWHEATAALKAFMAGPPCQSVDDVAAQLDINPANLRHWLAGHRPHPKFRRALAELSGGAIVEATWATVTQRGRAMKRAQARAIHVAQAARYHRPATNERHGMSGTVEYQTWRNMLSRCYYPRDKKYKYYGERGVTVCERWRESFANFFADMGPRPQGRFSIERKENSLGYELDNCIWMPRSRQNAHRSNNLLLTFEGRTMCASDWDRELGFTHAKVAHRWGLGLRGADLFVRDNSLRERALARLKQLNAQRRGTGKLPTCNLGAQLLFGCLAQRRLSRRDAARSLGISLSGLVLWMRGKVRPWPHVRERIAAWSDGAVVPSAWDAPAQKVAA